MDLNINNNQQDPISAQEVRFRCPCCQKLFCTQPNVFEDVASQFECVSCLKTFLLYKEKNEFGLYRTDLKQTVQFSTCPKCSYLKPKEKDECPSCGIIVSKYEEIQKVESPALFELNQLWQKIMSDFMKEDSHQIFIEACHRKQALNFAFKKYSDLKKTLGFDSHCERYMRQVELRLEQQFRATESITIQTVNKKNQFKKQQKFFLVAGVVGLCLLTLNKIIPTFPNFTGLVVAMTVLSFGLVFYSGEKNNIQL